MPCTASPRFKRQSLHYETIVASVCKNSSTEAGPVTKKTRESCGQIKQVSGYVASQETE